MARVVVILSLLVFVLLPSESIAKKRKVKTAHTMFNKYQAKLRVMDIVVRQLVLNMADESMTVDELHAWDAIYTDIEGQMKRLKNQYRGKEDRILELHKKYK